MIKRGFTLAYKERNELTLVMKSPEALSLFYYIEERLLECPRDKLNRKVIGNTLGCTKEFINETIALLIKYDVIMEVTFKKYLWNPYISLYRYDNGETIQRKWNTIRESNNFRRRGSDVNDDYLRYKKFHDVTIEEFNNLLASGEVKRTYRIVKRT